MLKKILWFNLEIKHGYIFELFKTSYRLILDDNIIFRATNESRDLVEDSERKQYGLLWHYANELIRNNPNSTVRMNTIPMPESPP